MERRGRVLGPDQYEAELDFDVGKKYNCLGLGTAAVIVMDEDTDMVAVARNIARFIAHESCGQCTPCREGTGWMFKILSRIEAGEGRTKDLDLLLEIAGSMGSAFPGSTICQLADAATGQSERSSTSSGMNLRCALRDRASPLLWGLKVILRVSEIPTRKVWRTRGGNDHAYLRHKSVCRNRILWCELWIRKGFSHKQFVLSFEVKRLPS